jgi:hypothetical protein
VGAADTIVFSLYDNESYDGSDDEPVGATDSIVSELPEPASDIPPVSIMSALPVGAADIEGRGVMRISLDESPPHGSLSSLFPLDESPPRGSQSSLFYPPGLANYPDEHTTLLPQPTDIMVRFEARLVAKNNQQQARLAAFSPDEWVPDSGANRYISGTEDSFYSNIPVSVGALPPDSGPVGALPPNRNNCVHAKLPGGFCDTDFAGD